MTAMVKATSFCGSPPCRSSPSARPSSPSRLPPASPTAVAKPEIFCQTVMAATLLPSCRARSAVCMPRAIGRLIPSSARNVKGTPCKVAATDEVLIRREGRAGRITMNRPAGAQRAHATPWSAASGRRCWPGRTIPAVELVLLDGAGDRALCAGGDVRALYDSRAQGSGARARLLARGVPAQRADRPLPQALCRHPGRHRHGRRHRPVRPRAPPHRHRALAARHARDRHRPHPRRRRHVAAGATRRARPASTWG